jgi:hypothetical protein
MNQDRTRRKLTAILSADVVGYSRLMEADEAWTVNSLDENKRMTGIFWYQEANRSTQTSGSPYIGVLGSYPLSRNLFARLAFMIIGAPAANGVISAILLARMILNVNEISPPGYEHRSVNN